MMKATEQTIQQIERAITKVADKFPAQTDASQLTDIHIRVTQETGELMVFDDDDVEVTRCVVDQWIDNKDDNFYEEITTVFRKCVEHKHTLIDNMSLLKPFSFVLEDEEKEHIAELYVADDDTVIIDPDMMEGLDKDLDDFLSDLLKEK